MEPQEKKEETVEKRAGGTRTIREDAEEQLLRTPVRSPGLEGQSTGELIQELRVHQVELEMQAEQLRVAQLALEESRDRYIDLYEFAPTGYLTFTDKALITVVNLTVVMLLGVERNDLVNHGLGQFIDPGDREVWDLYFMDLLNQGKKQACILTIRRGDGSTFPARLEGIRTSGRGGATTVRVAISDITDIWQIGALREREEKYRRLFETAQDGIIIVEEETGKIIDVNTFLIDMLGYPLEYFIDRHLWELGFIKDKSIAQHAFTELKKKGYIRYEDLPLETKDGRSMDVEFISNVYLVGNKKIIQCNIRDITARKRVEDALALASRKLNLLSRITRHDINNQLMTVNGFLDIVHQKVPDPTLEEYFTRIEKASSRISAMIQFTKEYENIGVNAPAWQECRTLVGTAEKQAPLGKVLVKNDLPAGLEVLADPLIVKVFYNLMDNAVRYGGKITTIRFTALDRDDTKVLVCEDDGDGIPPDEKEKIFERGFGKNTGLGLAISLEILAITGITIRETGEAGKGARFEMVVPKGGYRIREIT
jgi:PAS domain S-box-containing protein